MKSEEVFEYRNKRLIIRPESVRYEFGATVYIVENPVSIMYWAEPIELDIFRIGSKVKLRLMAEDGTKITFILRAYFGRGWSRINDVFDQILNSLWENYFGKIQASYDEEVDAGGIAEISNFQIDRVGISQIGEQGQRIKNILFEDASLKETYDQLIVSSISNPEEFIAIKNRWDWNAPIIQELIKKLCPLSN